LVFIINKYKGLSCPLANAKDLGEWIGASQKNNSLFNFRINNRPIQLDIFIKTIYNHNFSQNVNLFSKYIYNDIINKSDKKPTIIFVSSKYLAKNLSLELLLLMKSNNLTGDFINKFLIDEKENNEDEIVVEDEDSENNKIKDKIKIEEEKKEGEEELNEEKKLQIKNLLTYLNESLLKNSIKYKIGYLHNELTSNEKKIIINLYLKGIIQILIISYDLLWELEEIKAYLVIIMGTQYYDGREHKLVEYKLSEIYEMMGKSGRQLVDGSSSCILYCNSSKKEYYKKFISEPFPVESHLGKYIN
jgi:pre-mRNA-splicing helicase BRR2